MVDVAAWLFRNYPVVRQPAAATIDAIQVTPARLDLQSSAVTTRIPSVSFHGHWYAQRGVPLRNWIKGANIPDASFSNLVPGSNHISIQDLREEFARPISQRIESIITTSCEMVLDPCCPDEE